MTSPARSAITTLEDAQVLQDDLDLLMKWSKDWQMTFNPTKCYTLRIFRLHSTIEYNYNISGSILNPVSDHPYLGVHLSSKLSWNKHINIITTKASNQLNFLRRN